MQCLFGFCRSILVAGLVVFLLSSNSFVHADQFDIPSPLAGKVFGQDVVVLPNGNIVITDPGLDEGGVNNIGAVYLYDGGTLTLISTLKGSTANDGVANGGLVVLTNGNFVVRSPAWNNTSPSATNAGAVTWCSAITGCGGVVSAANSLVGGTNNDAVGSTAVAVLTNGNYVVISSDWDNTSGPVSDAGATTFGNGATGSSGLVTAANSLVGGRTNDLNGADVVPLANGNYVLRAPSWDNLTPLTLNVGAATWGNGATGTSGVITSANSLTGGTANDAVGSAVVALTNGNYVVASQLWDNPTGPIQNVGATTWANGATGITGPVTSANSLIGGTTGDQIGGDGIFALTNGNYVVASHLWNFGGPLTNGGAATWGNGSTGMIGVVTAANSLTGTRAGDNIGLNGVTALTNGNYVVKSPEWNSPTPTLNVGAATWGNGATGTSGPVSASNSLIGSSAGDRVGTIIEALSNGNYVVGSKSWRATGAPAAGAATWGNGATGTTDVVSALNSLVGAQTNDQVGTAITALTNGNYVVSSPLWDNVSISDAGAATWGNGLGGTTGPVTPTNSLVGSIASDQVSELGVTRLTNGNYVVTCPDCDIGGVTNSGAVTWGNGLGGTVGLLTSGNSLVGGANADRVGDGGVVGLTNGTYLVISTLWNNPVGSVNDARASTWGNGLGGTVGLISSANSIVGTVPNNIVSNSFDAVRNRLFAGRTPIAVTTLFFDTTAVASGNLNSPGTWSAGVPTPLTNVTIASGFTVTNTAPAMIGSLNVQSGGTLSFNSDLKVIGRLTLSAQINAGASTLGLSCSSTVLGASATNFVLGNVSRDFCSITGALTRYPTSEKVGGAADGLFTFPVGTANGYSPVDVNPTALGKNIPFITSVPSSLTVKAFQAPQPNQNPSISLKRYWTLTESGDLTADLTFHYLDSDVMGNESIYQIFKVVSGITQRFPHNPPNVVIDTVANTGLIKKVNSFSDWTLGEPAAPTAANSEVNGVIIDEDGRPVAGAGVRLSGTQNRLTVTDALGRYHFDELETNGFYTVSPARANFTFSPAQRSFSAIGLHIEAAFSATLSNDGWNPLDTTEYFVRQQYLDFLGREPDEAGLSFWYQNIESCGADVACREEMREETSAAFFLSIEFQETGYFVYRTYQAAFGDIPGAPVPVRLNEFQPDTRVIGAGVVVNQGDWAATLDANQQAYLNAFVAKSRFTSAYPFTLTPDEFVDRLFANAGVAPSSVDRQTVISEFGAAPTTSDLATRARALRRVAENTELTQNEFGSAFVLMQYFGYLRRDADASPDTNYSGYDFWLTKLSNFHGDYQQAEMVRAFLLSNEYRGRFPQ